MTCQVEHHLFPRVPRHNLRRLQGVVRAFCAEHGILLQAYTGAYKPELREHAELARLARGVPAAAELVPHPAAILSMRWTL